MASETATASKSKTNETITRLQRGILRLALSFHGQNPELDTRLKELGSLLRSGTKDERLQRLIDEIVDIIVAQDIPQNAEQRGGRTLCDLLDRIQSRFEPSDTLKPIVEKLSMPLDLAAFSTSLDDAANAVALMAGQAPVVDDNAVRAVTHLLENVQFSDAAAREIEVVKDQLAKREDDIELLRGLDEAARVISAEIENGDGATNISAARDQLLLLMNLIPFPSSLTDRSAQDAAHDRERGYRSRAVRLHPRDRGFDGSDARTAPVRDRRARRVPEVDAETTAGFRVADPPVRSISRGELAQHARPRGRPRQTSRSDAQRTSTKRRTSTRSSPP